MITKFIETSDQPPPNDKGRWSEPVIAITDTGDIFKLCCMNGYWQRSEDFIESGATKVIAWAEIPVIYK